MIKLLLRFGPLVGFGVIGEAIRRWAPVPGIDNLYAWAFWLYVILAYLVLKIPGQKIGRHWRFSKEAIAKWLEEAHRKQTNQGT